MIYVFYRPNTEQERPALEFQRLLQKQHLDAELINLDSRAGAVKAEVYGLMRFPSVIVVRRNGELIQSWPGIIPTISDIEFFAHSGV